jgi:predicted metal-dependent phosphoesterase TrpH
LQAWGVDVSVDEVVAEAAGGAIGRPHVARVLVRHGTVDSLDEAFNLYLGRGRPAYVGKVLPPLSGVADRVHRHGGLVSAAHLRDRAPASPKSLPANHPVSGWNRPATTNIL